MTAYRLDKTPIHIGPGAGATPVDGFEFTGEGFGAYIQAHCTPDEPGRLAMVEHSPERWGAWECHTEGDEVVILLTGKAEFIQEIDGEERRTVVSPGEAIINPKGVWHSADVIEPFSAVYLTPCPGTKHRPRS